MIQFLEKNGEYPNIYAFVEPIFIILWNCLSKIDDAGFVLVRTGEQDFALIDFGWAACLLGYFYGSFVTP